MSKYNQHYVILESIHSIYTVGQSNWGRCIDYILLALVLTVMKLWSLLLNTFITIFPPSCLQYTWPILIKFYTHAIQQWPLFIFIVSPITTLNLFNKNLVSVTYPFRATEIRCTYHPYIITWKVSPSSLFIFMRICIIVQILFLLYNLIISILLVYKLFPNSNIHYMQHPWAPT